MALIVQKYGGTSVGSIDHIRKVADHVAGSVRSGNSMIITISAMGEQTDDLILMARELNKRPPRRELDMLLTAGERISAALLAIALENIGIPSVSLTGSQCGILTDETHGNARIKKILGDRIRQGIADNRVVIVAGFQGVSPLTKEITTLGRGGTDLSALAIAAAMKADKCQLFKDVDGVFTTDPRICPGARIIRELSWSSMVEMAWNGANVLQPRSAHVALKYKLPFEIRSSINLDREGTLVCGVEKVESPVFEAISIKKDISQVEMKIPTADANAVYAFVFEYLWQQGDAPQFCQLWRAAEAHNLALAVKGELAGDFCTAVLEKFPNSEVLRHTDKLGTVTLVGYGFQQSPESVAQVTSLLPGDTVAFEATNTEMNICVNLSDLSATVERLHKALFEK